MAQAFRNELKPAKCLLSVSQFKHVPLIVLNLDLVFTPKRYIPGSSIIIKA